MKKKVLILGAVLLLCLVAGAAFFYWNKKSSGSQAEETSESANKNPVPVRLPFLPVPVVEHGELRYYAIVGITLETGGDGDAAAVKANLPRVMDALLDALHSEEGHPLQDQAIEPALLGRKLKAALASLDIGSRVHKVVVSPNQHPVPR